MYRNEYKYLIGPASAELIRHRLGALIDRDPHADANGDYFIRSVYFDDDTLSAFYDKLAGVAARNKYRLRFYNMDTSRFSFEAKRKRDRYVNKECVPISPELAEKMLAGEPLSATEASGSLLGEFSVLCRSSGMHPCVIVDYVRTAFVYPVGNVRITLDSDLRAESFQRDNVFICRGGVPVLEDGDVILEVKYTDYLPPWIAEALSDVPKILSANSKYCNCLAVYL
jgi:SPX domain protein involved in polyphosphate accumulation